MIGEAKQLFSCSHYCQLHTEFDFYAWTGKLRGMGQGWICRCLSCGFRSWWAVHSLGSVALLLSCCWLHRCDTTEMPHPCQSLMKHKSRKKVIHTVAESKGLTFVEDVGVGREGKGKSVRQVKGEKGGCDWCWGQGYCKEGDGAIWKPEVRWRKNRVKKRSSLDGPEAGKSASVGPCSLLQAYPPKEKKPSAPCSSQQGTAQGAWLLPCWWLT